MKSNLERLLANAACKDQPTLAFYEDEWFRKRIPYTEALAKCRSVCDTCPVRWECHAMEADAERGSAEQHRGGVFAGLTAHQRYSLERRGIGLACPGEDCGEPYDPVELRKGNLACQFCGTYAHMEPVPDRGDDWANRHTLLANATLIWLTDNVAAGAEVPTAGKLSKVINARVVDLRRVYEALQADQVIVRTDTGALVRTSASASAHGWVPRHLRIKS